MLSVRAEPATLEGSGPIQRVFDWLGDHGMMLEFPNDFRVIVIVDLDAETTVFYKYTSSEDNHICAECDGLEEYDSITGYNRFYSCEHLTNTFSSRYEVVLSDHMPDGVVDHLLTFG